MKHSRSNRLQASCFAIAAMLLLVATCAVLNGCKKEPNKVPVLEQPDHASSVPMPVGEPVDWDVYVKTVQSLDESRAREKRLDVELANAENRKAAANLDTWKRFGRYSYLFMAIGVGLLVLSMLPWTKAIFAGTGSIAFIFIGGGVLFGALPHILEQYGPTAFYPLAVIIVLYVGLLAFMDIKRRWRKAKAEAVVAKAALDPAKPNVGVEELIAVRQENNPTFAAAMGKALPA